MARNQQTGGVGFIGLLTIAFIVLKLTHVIDWSWPWVLAPLWAPLCLVLVIVGLVLLFDAYKTRRRKKRLRESIKK